MFIFSARDVTALQIHDRKEALTSSESGTDTTFISLVMQTCNNLRRLRSSQTRLLLDFLREGTNSKNEVDRSLHV